MALWQVLASLAPAHGWQLAVAHVHHGLRGAAADADVTFVRRQCRAQGVRCHVHRADVEALARIHGCSFEMQARTVRYDFFKACLRRFRYDVLALAHTRDDQAETVLARVLRGCSLTGLAAIRPCTQRDGMAIVRPLLAFPKETLVHAMQSMGVTWREDASNQDPAYLRNRLRNDWLPSLRAQFNPQLDAALARLAELLQADDAVLQECMEQDWTACRMAEQPVGLSVAALAKLPVARRQRLLWHWCVRQWPACSATLDYGTVRRIDRLLVTSEGQAWIPLQAGGAVVRSYDALFVQAARALLPNEPPHRQKIRRPGVTTAPDWGVEVMVEKVQGYQRVPRARWGEGVLEAYVSAAHVGRANFYLRAWQPGDRMRPQGMRGSRKLQDIFTDLKIPRDQRAGLPLLELRGRVVWIPGYGIDQACAVPNARAPAWHLVIRTLARAPRLHAET